jgi:hypothetical protein
MEAWMAEALAAEAAVASTAVAVAAAARLQACQGGRRVAAAQVKAAALVEA